MSEMIRYQRYEHNSIPDNLKKPLAELFQNRHKEFSEMPTHHFAYYLTPLQSKQDPEICKLYILATENEDLLGYALLEYRESKYNENSGTLMIFVSKDKRNNGIGKKNIQLSFTHSS
jgi:hypothetical protein